MAQRIVIVAVLASAIGCSAPPQSATSMTAIKGSIIDLSHAYGEDTVFWPTAERFHLDVVNDGVTPGGFYYAANNFRTAEHGGTHVDAPVHFAKGRHAVDEIPVEQLIGPAVVVDVTAAAGSNADYLVTIQDLQNFETAHGRIPDDAIL